MTETEPTSAPEPAVADAVDPCTPVEASRLLGVSEKRVRQLVDAGRLEAASRSPLRVVRASVLALRDERKAESAAGLPPGASSRTVRGSAGPGLSAVEVLARLDSITATMAEQSRRAIEATEHAHLTVEAALRDALAEANARAAQAEARAAALQAEKDAATAALVVAPAPAPQARRRRWWAAGE